MEEEIALRFQRPPSLPRSEPVSTRELVDTIAALERRLAALGAQPDERGSSYMTRYTRYLRSYSLFLGDSAHD